MAVISINTNIPELEGSDTALCLSNLEALWARGDRVSESALAMLSELADAILRDADGDSNTVDSILLSLLASDTSAESAPYESLPAVDRGDSPSLINQRDLLATATYAGLTTRLRLYRFLAEKEAAANANAHKGEFAVHTSAPSAGTNTPQGVPAPEAEGRIAYMAGAFADKAYSRFSTCVPHARAATCHSFREACEEVRAGHCEYCILPLTTRQSGRLVSFAQLMLRYGLVSVAVTDLEDGAAEEQSMRFALLRRRDDGHFPPLADPQATHLEILHTMSAPSFPELLMAADYCGLSFDRADTIPPPNDTDFSTDESWQDAPRVLCVLTTTGADLSTFRRYLRLEAAEDILMGHYTIL